MSSFRHISGPRNDRNPAQTHTYSQDQPLSPYMDKKAGNDHNSGREPSNQRYRRRKLTDFGAVTGQWAALRYLCCQLQPVKSRSIHIERLEKLHTFVNKGYLWNLKVNLLQNTDPLNQINKISSSGYVYFSFSTLCHDKNHVT